MCAQIEPSYVQGYAALCCSLSMKNYIKFMEVLFMNNFRNVNNDILKEWFLFREDEIASLSCDEDKHHWVYFDEISQKILRNSLNFFQKLLTNRRDCDIIPE